MLVSSVWENLENQQKGLAGGYLLQRILPDSNHCLYLALEKQSGARALMMQVSQLSAAKITELPTSKGFDVKKVRLEEDETGKIIIQVILNDKKYSDIFSRLIQDIVDSVEKIQQENKAVLDLVMRLQRWQFFLARNNPEGLSSEEQQGLFGELWFLKNFLFTHLNYKKAVTSWKGPTSTVQDFYFTGCVVEVKTTTTKAHQKLFISNEKQLDNDGIDALVLLHLPLEERPESGETLSELIVSIRDILANTPEELEIFESMLFQSGYLDLHSENYNNKGYIVKNPNFYIVRDDFPRIIEKDLRNGVGDIRYSISVAECKHFIIPEDNVIKLITGAKHE